MTDQDQEVSGFCHDSIDEEVRETLFRMGNESRDGTAFQDITSPVRDWRHYATKEFIAQLVESTPFKAVVFMFIVFNAVILGVQTNRHLENEYEQLFTALDSCCLSVAVLEILLKLYADVCGFWKSGWSVFDFVVVMMSFIAPSFTFLKGTKIVRVIRILRSLRLLRGINVLPGLQIVVQTVLQSLSDMANIVLLLLIVMFIFALLGVTFFGDKNAKHFGDLPTALFTLFICVTQDGWMGIFQELEQEGLYVAAAVYFITFIMIGAFVFANLVVAVVVTNLELSVEQRERQARDSQVDKYETEGKEEEVTATVDASVLLHQHWRSHRPYEIPDLTGARVERLENYFAVLTTMEDNMNRFKALKQELAEIVHEVKDLNTKWDETTSHVSLPCVSSGGRASTSLRGNKTGDLLSDLVMLNREHCIDSKNASVMSDLVKQTVIRLYRRESVKNVTRSSSHGN